MAETGIQGDDDLAQHLFGLLRVALTEQEKDMVQECNVAVAYVHAGSLYFVPRVLPK